MDFDDFPLSAFEVDCDGSSCGSRPTGLHIHPPQWGTPALARVKVRNWKREAYSGATGLTRLMVYDDSTEEAQP